MVKNAFFLGLSLGVIAGSYLVKHCPQVREAMDSAEGMVKEKISDMKCQMKQKKEEMAADEFAF